MSKEAYDKARNSAKGELLKAIDRQYDRVKKNARYSQRARSVEVTRLEGVKAAFEDDNTLPDESGTLKSHIDEYVKEIGKARERLKKEYERAEGEYRKRGDVARANGVKDEGRLSLSRAQHC